MAFIMKNVPTCTFHLNFMYFTHYVSNTLCDLFFIFTISLKAFVMKNVPTCVFDLNIMYFTYYAINALCNLFFIFAISLMAFNVKNAPSCSFHLNFIYFTYYVNNTFCDSFFVFTISLMAFIMKNLSFHPAEIGTAVGVMNGYVDAICSWALENRLNINSGKTKALLIGGRACVGRIIGSDPPRVRWGGMRLSKAGLLVIWV